MEGKGRSRRRSPHQQWKRRLSSVLAIVLTAVMVLNMPLSIDGLGLHVSNAFASASNADRKDSVWATASNAKYKQGESQDVDIYVIADDNGAVPGNTSSMTLYLKNNTNQMITEGVLTFKGSHIQKEDGVFQDIGAGDEASQVIVSGPGQDAGTTPESGAAADDGAAANEGAAVNDGAPQAADVSGNDAAQGTGLAQDTVTSGEGLLYEESFDADEAGEDSDFAEDFEGDEEDSEEEETWKLTGIDLQPGEMHEVSFAFYTDEDVKSTKAHVKFSFAGEDEEGERISSDTQFYYSIGFPHVNISLEDGMQIESNVNNDMEIWMTEPDWVDEDLEERIEDQEEKEAEKEQEEDADNSGSSDTASDSNASKSDADRADTASDSQADREEKPSVIRDEEKIDKYTDEAMTISESRVSYTVEIFGAEYDLHARKADEVEDIGWISCVYKIAKETQPGIYYGKVTAAGRWNNKKFTSEQGFLFEVTGEWDGNYTAKSENVTVHAHAEDGVLPKNVTLKVTELEEGGAEYNKAKEAMDGTDIQFDGIKALDIRFENQNGEEVEPEGEVQISIEMKEGALPADAALDMVEVHHLKEVDDETIEVETVADAAGLTDGTVKSGEAVQAELEEIAADAEEETEASADVYTQAAIPAAAAAPVTLDAVAEVDKDTVAVAEFSVESFSKFTITWGNSYEVTVKYGNLRGTGQEQTFFEWQFPDAESGPIELGADFEFSGYAKNQYRDVNGNLYYYSKARLVSDGEVLAEYGSGVSQLFQSQKASDGSDAYQLYYYDNGQWNLVPNGSTIQLFYEITGWNPLGIVDTVDTSETININLYDYSSGTKIGSGEEDRNNIVGGKFKFADNSNPPTNWSSDSGVIQNLVLRTLTGNNTQKYPQLNDSRETSLGPLFSNGRNGKALTVINGANHLFQEDEEGYLYYDSSENFATIEDDGNFTVYSTPRNTQDVGASYAKFMPFNDLQTNTDSDGYLLTEDPNYHFGMTVDFAFLMPKEGKVNGNDMVFEFSGDDDVWVFIDDVLVLDMGGIHDSYNGSINFATGEVWVSGVSGDVSYERVEEDGQWKWKYVYRNQGEKKELIVDRFSAANSTWDPTPYKTHTLKFYYFERGAGGSNCKIRFNMPRVPEGTINFGKEIGYTNTADSADFDFYFKAYINESGDASLELEEYELYKGSYDIYDEEGNLIKQNLTTDEDGTITLKDGQYARIKGTEENGITETSRFYVVETGVFSDQYDVKINDSDAAAIPVEGDGPISGGTEDGDAYRSDDYVVGDLQYVIFTNDVVADNAFNLIIRKEMLDAPVNAGPFYIQLHLGETGQLYTGDYTLHQNGAESSEKAENGLIELRPGEYAEVTGLIGGNTIKIVEVDSNGKQFTGDDTYVPPTYLIQGTKNTEGESIVTPEMTEPSSDPISVTVKAGKELGSNPTVTATVTNSLKPSVTIRKEVHGAMGEKDKEFDFNIVIKDSQGEDVTDQFIGKNYSEIMIGSDGVFSLKHGQSITINGLPYNGTITVKETDDSSTGYTTTIKVNNEQVEGSSKSTTQTLSQSKEILFVNNKGLPPATGVFTNNYPFVLMLAIAALGTSTFIYPSCRRRRHRGDK